MTMGYFKYIGTFEGHEWSGNLTQVPLKAVVRLSSSFIS